LKYLKTVKGRVVLEMVLTIGGVDGASCYSCSHRYLV